MDFHEVSAPYGIDSAVCGRVRFLWLKGPDPTGDERGIGSSMRTTIRPGVCALQSMVPPGFQRSISDDGQAGPHPSAEPLAFSPRTKRPKIRKVGPSEMSSAGFADLVFGPAIPGSRDIVIVPPVEQYLTALSARMRNSWPRRCRSPVTVDVLTGPSVTVQSAERPDLGILEGFGPPGPEEEGVLLQRDQPGVRLGEQRPGNPRSGFSRFTSSICPGPTGDDPARETASRSTVSNCARMTVSGVSSSWEEWRVNSWMCRMLSSRRAVWR